MFLTLLKCKKEAASILKDAKTEAEAAKKIKFYKQKKSFRT